MDLAATTRVPRCARVQSFTDGSVAPLAVVAGARLCQPRPAPGALSSARDTDRARPVHAARAPDPCRRGASDCATERNRAVRTPENFAGRVEYFPAWDRMPPACGSPSQL